ncbi:MAG: hypothetical protein NWF10_00110 [Candidatus Bathyarchaeota archaeon]|nr:hypothetical protein [Candidatus Bathyarchaeota archaeon]
MHKAERLIITALFGSVIFVTRVFIPPPIDKLLIVVDAIFLVLGALFLKKWGATSVGAVGGVLTGLWRPAVPFSFALVFIYGILVDILLVGFKVKASSNGVDQNRLIVSLSISTFLIAVISYYSTTIGLNIISANLILDIVVMFMGPLSGAVAGYAAAYLWNKYLRNINIDNYEN